MSTTSRSTTSRYLPTYREREVSLCCDYAAQGKSLCFVGIAGSGKSNIVKVLTQDRAVRGRYLGDKLDVVRFAAIDANTWDGTSQHLWEMLLSALFDAIKALSQPIFDPKITYLSEDEKGRRRVQITIDYICQSLDQRLMIILDDFDNVLTQGPLHMIEQFNLFRSAGNRERLAYLVFTKRLPHVLGRRFELDTRCKFYDLFRTDIFALEPYTPTDARQMVHHLNRQLPEPLPNGVLGGILWLGGGHARLLKVIFDSWVKQAPPAGNQIDYFVAQSDVQEECRRMLVGLHLQERAAAIRLAQGQSHGDDDDTLDHLRRRGLLLDIAQGRWFSPLWAEYLRSFATA
jgi:hypothetical protein